MTNTDSKEIIPYRIEFKVGRKQYTVDLNSTLGPEAATRRARMALAIRSNRPLQQIKLISCTAYPEA